MSISRISLYPHELETIAHLTVELTRLVSEGENPPDPAALMALGTTVFAELVKTLYGEPMAILKSTYFPGGHGVAVPGNNQKAPR